MRILFLSERYPPHITGGYEIACASVAEGLRMRGHDVLVLTSNYGVEKGSIVGNGVHRMLHYKQQATGFLDLGRWEIADYRTFQKTIERWKPDLISAWSLYHLFPSLHHAIREAPVPVVYNIHDAWLPRHLAHAAELEVLWKAQGRTPARRAAKWAIRRLYRGPRSPVAHPVTPADLRLENVLFCSRFRMVEHGELGFSAANGTVIYNGIGVDTFSGMADYEPGTPLKVLFVGRLVPEKGVHTAVDAVMDLARRGAHPVTLSVAGAAFHPKEYADQLQRRVESDGLSDRVRFLGMVQYDALPDLYRRHHVLVFPSLANEGFPLTLLEAMASGLVVVGTTTGGSAEILCDGVTGLTFPPGDAGALANCLARLSAESTLFPSLAAAGHRFVCEHFTLNEMLAETEQFMRKITTR